MFYNLDYLQKTQNTIKLEVIITVTVLKVRREGKRERGSHENKKIL